MMGAGGVPEDGARFSLSTSMMCPYNLHTYPTRSIDLLQQIF